MMTDPACEAVRLAKRSYMTQRHGAVITRNGEIIARGFNHHVTHLNHLFSLHAEMDAIADLKKRYASECKSKRWLRDCRLYVVRIGPDSQDNPLRMSKPCVNCKQAIQQIGIPIVFYSNEINPNIIGEDDA
jgi:deoxycytidylate deaminase